MLVQRRVEIGELGAAVGAAGLLAGERGGGDEAGERVRVVAEFRGAAGASRSRPARRQTAARVSGVGGSIAASIVSPGRRAPGRRGRRARRGDRTRSTR